MRTLLLVFALTGWLWAKPVLKEGYQIEPPPAWRQVGDSPLTLACAGPVLSRGVPATLTVLVQPEGDLTRYLATTLRELKKADATILWQRTRPFGQAAGGEISWVESAGKYQMKYHAAFFCRGNTTYLCTCSANEQDWPNVGPLFTRSVASFRPR